jgi:hypothetical protein
MRRQPGSAGLFWVAAILVLFVALAIFVLAGSNLNIVPPGSFES